MSTQMKPCIRIRLVLLLVFLVAACSTARIPPPVEGPPPDSDQIAQQLRAAAHRWEGTPHRLGGNDHHGIDCSGLVVRIYSELFAQTLPRTADQLARTGRPVPSQELVAGDLVFFRPPAYKLHVGIYLGGGEFLHASTRQGVVISRLADAYWREAYWTARRVMA
jgi:probable lipoprotein NlpC